MPTREQQIYRVTLGGSVVNLLLLAFKFVAGIVGGSAAMLADAIHSLSDFLTDLVVIVFVSISGKPCDANHDFGHGKYETLATTFIGLMLVGVGIGIGWNGITQIIRCLEGETLEAPGSIALIAALVSIVAKEGLYQWTLRVGKRTSSPTVIANAWHHRSDALSSIGTALGIGGAILLGEKGRMLDPLAAVLVSLLILKVAWDLLKPSLEELLEKSLPEEEERLITQIILEEKGVSEPHNLRTRHIGNYAAIDVHIRMDGSTPLAEAHQATREIEQKLRQHFGTSTFINIHVEPTK